MSIALILTGLGLIAVGHAFPFPYAPLAVIGPVVVGLGVTFGALMGTQFTHPVFAVVAGFVVTVFLLLVGYFNILGLQAWGL